MANPRYNATTPMVQPSMQYSDSNQMMFHPQYQQTQGAFPLTRLVTPQVPIYQQQQPTIQTFQQQSQDIQVSNQQAQSEWTAVINKKRLRSPEVLNGRKQTRISDYWLQKPFETNNKFSSLTEDNDESKEKDQQNNVKDVPKPPPITIYKVGVSSRRYKVAGVSKRLSSI
jgi:hypothetical protein